MEGRFIVIVRCAEGKEILYAGSGTLVTEFFVVVRLRERNCRLTSAVLGTLSQKTSILIFPRVVCKVTDIVAVSGAYSSAILSCVSWFTDQLSIRLGVDVDSKQAKVQNVVGRT